MCQVRGAPNRGVVVRGQWIWEDGGESLGADKVEPGQGVCGGGGSKFIQVEV